MFETVLRISVLGSPESAGNLRSLSFSIALHGLAIGAVALFSVRSTIKSAEPTIPIVFLVGNAPPPPKGDGTPASAETALRTSPAVAALRQPAEDAASGPTADEMPQGQTEGTADPSSETGGDPGGLPGSLPGGIAGSEGKEGPAAGDSDKTYRVGGNVVAPRLLHRVDPVYPDWARKIHVEGVIVLEAIIGTTGNVEELHVVKSIHPLLDAAALQAVEQWRYRPATLNGFPVRVYLTVTAEFRLR